MSRADGKAERDRIEAERAVREAIAAKQAAAQSSSVPKRPAETTAERHRRIAEKTREAFAELDEIDPPKRKPVTSYSETENPRTAVSRSRTEVQPRQASSQSNRNSTPADMVMHQTKNVDLVIEKKDATTAETLKGAEFTVYKLKGYIFFNII